MQAKYFENYKNKLTFLSIFSWIIAVFFTIQNKLLQLTLKTYLNYNLQNTVTSDIETSKPITRPAKPVVGANEYVSTAESWIDFINNDPAHSLCKG